jgi:hypothetical protein
MDYLRSCYTIRARLVQGSDTLYTIRWMKAQPGALQYPGLYAYASHVWDDSLTMPRLHGPGEETAPQEWSPNRVCPLPGTCLPAHPEWFLTGIPPEALTGPLPTTLCCETLGAVDQGSLVYSGSYATLPGVSDTGSLVWSGTDRVGYHAASDGGTLAMFGCGIAIPSTLVWLDPFVPASVVDIPPHVPIIGSGYTLVAGDWATQNGFGCADSPGADSDLLIWDDGTTDYLLGCTLTCYWSDATDRADAGIVIRFQDVDNMLFVNPEPSRGNVVLYQLLGGTLSALATATANADEAISYSVVITDDGSQIVVYIDGLQIFNVTTSQFSGQTKKGLRLGQQGTPPGAAHWNGLFVLSR